VCSGHTENSLTAAETRHLSSLRDKFKESMNDAKTMTSLSPREIAVLRHLVHGATLSLIAYDLDIPEATAMRHLRIIYKKLEVENRSQAVAWARQNEIG
jgi:DNA-binding NarL/FixJ family response regulator